MKISLLIIKENLIVFYSSLFVSCEKRTAGIGVTHF